MSNWFKKIPLKEQVLLTKRLSFLIRAGVPIVDSLAILKRRSRGGSARVLSVLAEDVNRGKFLSAGFNRFQNIFGSFAVNIVRIGEATGMLDENLNYLAEELQKKHELRKKIVSALIYPVVILVATLSITGILTVYVLPKILPIFGSLHAALPVSTRILIWVSNAIRGYGLGALGIVSILAIVHWILIKRIQQYRLGMDRVILRTPILSRLYQSYYLANLARTLGLLLKSDVKILEAIGIAAETSGNLQYQKNLEELKQHVSKGDAISGFLFKHPELYPGMFSEMVAVGERAGNLSESFLYIATFYENELDALAKNLSSVLEPFLMIVMGLIVGFIAISIITPIYDITQHL